jgi:CBS domain-containing protein
MSHRSVGALIEANRHLVSAGPEISVREAAATMAGQRCGCLLVMEDDRLLGIFTERDLLKRVVAPGLDPDATPLREVMTKEPDTIGADEPIQEAIRRMDEFGYRYLPVAENNRIVGVLSGRHLPFGEIIGMQWELDERHAVAERLW